MEARYDSCIVSGRARPASSGRVKTGHFEETWVHREALPPKERKLWRIDSRWPRSMRS